MSNSLAQSLARKLNTTTTLSMESVDVDVNIGQDAIVDEDGAALSPLAPATDEPIVEAQQTEIAEEESEIDSTESEAETTESDIETLESIQLHLTKSLEHGGLDTVSYEMFGLTMDHIYRKYGIDSQDVLPSMESFSNDALGQTTVSMEKVGNTLRTIQEGAVQLLKKLWFQLKKFLSSLKNLGFSLKKRAQALSKQAGAMNSGATGSEIKLFSAKHLLINGKLPDRSALIKAYREMANGSQSMQSVLGSYINSTNSMVNDVLNSKADSESDREKVIAAVNRSSEDFKNLNKLLVFKDAQFEVVKIEGKDNMQLQLMSAKLKTNKAPERGTDSEGYKINPMSAGEVKEMADLIIKSIDGVEKLLAVSNKSELEKNIIKLSDKTDGDDGTDKAKIKMAKKAVRTLISLQGKFISYINTTNKAMLDYSVQSLQAAKKGKNVDNSNAIENKA